jgi:hypothetical protein
MRASGAAPAGIDNLLQGYHGEGLVAAIATAAGLDVQFPRLGNKVDLRIFDSGHEARHYLVVCLVPRDSGDYAQVTEADILRDIGSARYDVHYVRRLTTGQPGTAKLHDAVRSFRAIEHLLRAAAWSLAGDHLIRPPGRSARIDRFVGTALAGTTLPGSFVPSDRDRRRAREARQGDTPHERDQPDRAPTRGLTARSPEPFGPAGSGVACRQSGCSG